MRPFLLGVLLENEPLYRWTVTRETTVPTDGEVLA
jgi:hypothetical protein